MKTQIITLKKNYFRKCLIQFSPFQWFCTNFFLTLSLPRYWIGFLFHEHFSSINYRNFYESEKVPVNPFMTEAVIL